MVEQHPSMIDGTLERLRAAQADIRDEYLAANDDPWIIGYSGGKDSTLLTQLVFEMLLDLAASGLSTSFATIRWSSLRC